MSSFLAFLCMALLNVKSQNTTEHIPKLTGDELVPSETKTELSQLTATQSLIIGCVIGGSAFLCIMVYIVHWMRHKNIDEQYLHTPLSIEEPEVSEEQMTDGEPSNSSLQTM